MKSRFLRGLLSLTLAITLLIGCSGASLQVSPTPTPNPSPTLAPTSTVTNPTPSALVDYVYYQIEGSTAGELRAQMNQLGPADRLGQHDAYTKWYVSWSYPYSIEGGECATGPVEVEVEVTFTLPQWDPPADASQELMGKWNAYMTALQTHEDGHKDIAIQAGNEILQTLEALLAYPTCSELEKAADAAGEGVLDQYRQQETIYDRTTDHGATRNLRFPQLC